MVFLIGFSWIYLAFRVFFLMVMFSDFASALFKCLAKDFTLAKPKNAQQYPTNHKHRHTKKKSKRKPKRQKKQENKNENNKKQENKKENNKKQENKQPKRPKKTPENTNTCFAASQLRPRKPQNILLAEPEVEKRSIMGRRVEKRRFGDFAFFSF